MPLSKKPVLRLVAYYRANLAGGEVSASNLDKQRAAVDAYCWLAHSEVVSEFVEIEDSETETRPQLALAISTACRTNAGLLIAGIGFLVENVPFLSKLYEAEKTSNMQVFACGYSSGNPLPVKFMLDAAKFTARSRAATTKAGLEAAKARGVKLGTAGFSTICIARAARLAKAATKRKDCLVAITRIQRSGVKTLQAIADALIAQGVKTPRGNANWTPTQVRRVIKPGGKSSHVEANDAVETSKPPAEPDRVRNRVLH